MREIVLDTETTGLDPGAGHRVVEIGCVELYNHIPTGRTFHQYVNPERDMPAEAEAVHGLSADRLAGEPRFETIAEDFLEFVGDAKLVAHNAPFDLGFLNAELERLGRTPLGFDRVVDTLALARRRHPGGPNGLDDLCRRYSIDNSRRSLHGALLDAELLAEVYIELIGGRQAHLVLIESTVAVSDGQTIGIRPRPEPVPARLNAADIAAHAAFVAGLGDNALWRRYQPGDTE